MKQKSGIKRMMTLLVLGVLLLCQACSKSDGHHSAKTYVLVHGAWQAPWVWDQVKERLLAAGQHVVIVQLPAHGNDSTSPAAVSINRYRDVVIGAINGSIGDDGSKVILVGHSLAGMVVSAVADSIPNAIEKMIYIGAYLPVSGQSLLDLANTDGQSYLPSEIIKSEDQLTLGIATDNITKTFCQDGSDSIKQELLNHFRAEPAIPFGDAVKLSKAFTGVKKYYIHTLQDHVVGPDLQNRMIAASNILEVYPINSSHSPFLSRPDSLTSILLTIAGK